MENKAAIKELFDSLYLSRQQLSLNQLDFVAGLQKYFKKNKSLSGKQLAALSEIRKYLPGDQVRYSGQLKQ